MLPAKNKMNILILFMHVVFGLIIGSFANVCILDLPKMSVAEEIGGESGKKEQKKKMREFLTRRSHCMDCGYELSWYDMIPVFSYLVYRGQCRKCKRKVSVQYPLIETANAILYLIVFLSFKEVSLNSIVICLFTSALLVLSVIDYRTMEIPAIITQFILGLGIIKTALYFQTYGLQQISRLDIALILLCIVIFLGLYYGNAMGGGDVKLLLFSIPIVGIRNVILGYILACLLAAIVMVPVAKIKKSGSSFPFGPFLGAALFIVGIWGEFLFEKYICYGFANL